ncbi:hypothetical protein MWT96_25180 (plasmid) [Prescottella equi]|uniref:Abortive infection protein-like C-terminal domain-containing protein n=2 Tax=Rhodococcus hoagii TaxID=43767 RepID=A0A9Q2Z675_RHOHA|nr:hypothetical protein [Prescottella equi]MBM4487733.1 hypothetical protein [Prescottella equi]MBM4498405.1 hypothetical protein [Prescottella equi]MBM4507714.1 hypothetical protein [Prescottella equi]MBM4512558.1 hypothetical protein [Prescottella equi]MBM4515518.1 hypothetical protein [Prescottella equi]
MIADDFFKSARDDVWGGTKSKFDMALIKEIRAGSVAGRTDIEIAIALSQLVHDELQAFGTEGGQSLNDAQIAAALTALRAVTRRLAIQFDPPYRNFTTFKSYWMRNDAYGSWQARRNLLGDLFEPLHKELTALEERSFDDLASAISPHAATGWPSVDEEILELRRRFQTATTTQDYRALGTNCVGVLEALSRTVYNPKDHLRDGEVEPPVEKTNIRIGRYIEDTLPGPNNEDIRGLTKKAAALAHHVKHSPTATRRDAGIAADSVILLANIVRRLDQDE